MLRRFLFSACAALEAAAFVLQGLGAEPLPTPLKLPPGLEEILPISRRASYFGDAFQAVHCPQDNDPFGTCGNLLFGGLALVDSHLSGQIRIKFFPPVNNIAHFEIEHPGGLTGDDTVLKAPQYYVLPIREARVFDPPGQVSSGDLNLLTGEVSNLDYRVIFDDTGITMLAKANPKLEAPVLRFPGVYGSASARFEQRPDGLLDFSFSGATFLPLGREILGDPIRFPLPFCTPELDCATIPSAGTSLHPHLVIDTREPEGPECAADCPEIPTNTLVELQAFGHNSSFGDNFHLAHPSLGRGAGRSHLVGRVRVQFGERFGDSVPFVVSTAPPAALLAEPPKTPISFPGLSLGLLGHDEILSFAGGATYRLKDVAFADDPFDLQHGVIDLRTGKVLGDLLYRGFIAQNLLFNLLEINRGRIAPGSFAFRGPARFERDRNGQTVFRFSGGEERPFEGFRFPSPDFIEANSFLAGAGSVLDIFFRLQAIVPPSRTAGIKSGSGAATDSLGDAIRYSYSIPCEPAGGGASFEYTNLNPARGGTFRLKSLAFARCFNSITSSLPSGQYDTVSFTAYGSWSQDDPENLHVATVQISSSPDFPYVSIIIDGGQTSNANTKPPIAPLP